jgi:4-phytase/acid phosphatase/peptide/nickel transport system substrate-binding protein
MKPKEFNVRTAIQRRVSMVVFLLVIAAVMTFSDSRSIAGNPRQGGTLTFGAENDFAGFEVLTSSSRLAINGSIVANTIMEPLFRMDDEERLIPVLGLSAEASENGKTWNITLRRGVTFHDGTSFNADAVVHHWNRILDPKNKFRARAAMGAIDSVIKIDEFRVLFNLKHPWLPFKRVISSTRSLVNLIPSSKAVERGLQNRSPVGTGPFMIKDWRSGDALVVVKNPHYWQKRLPNLDKIIFRPLPDSQTRFASLKSGQLDVVWMDRGNLIKKATSDPSLIVYTSEDNGAEIFIMNTSKPPLDDVNVRRALAYAHNQDLQVNMAYKQSIPVVHHPFGNQCDCPVDGYRPYNPKKARQLLAEYGQSVEIEVLHSSSKRGRDIGQITQRLFKDVGVKANPTGLDFGPVIKKVLSGQYQVSTWRISSRPDQGPALFLMFHSKSRANFSHYQNPAMDQLLIAQRMETNIEQRRQILCQIARLINEDAPILYRGGMRSHIIASQKVKGLSEMNNGILRLEKAWINR